MLVPPDASMYNAEYTRALAVPNPDPLQSATMPHSPLQVNDSPPYVPVVAAPEAVPAENPPEKVFAPQNAIAPPPLFTMPPSPEMTPFSSSAVPGAFVMHRVPPEMPNPSSMVALTGKYAVSPAPGNPVEGLQLAGSVHFAGEDELPAHS